jgi:predicted nuclease with TOPRIM domain
MKNNNKGKGNCYGEMLKQFKTLQERLNEMKETVSDLKERYENDVELREGCPDEYEADRAAYEAVREICLDSLLDIKPKGDA